MGRAAGVLAGLILLLIAPCARADTPFHNWAAVVVAGDWHAHSGKPSETFDNARRDVAATLEGFGFPHDAIRQYSVRPKRYPDTRPGKSELETIHAGLRDLAARNAAGCLFYISSHGAPEGVQLDQDIVPPQLLAAMIDDACPSRPSIVVVSACFSGVFLPPLQRDDRMILTAARADRASFGCGENDKYPYFDDCFLSSAQTARDFLALGRAAQACVRRKEVETNAEPASEPQLWIGPDLRPLLPLYAFPQPRLTSQAQARGGSAKNRR
ncbi:MAG: peptidase C13 [Caulobacter sp.]|nr:peptidase C13 [Caulobacter sp.]